MVFFSKGTYDKSVKMWTMVNETLSRLEWVVPGEQPQQE